MMFHVLAPVLLLGCKTYDLLLLHRNPEWGLPDIDVLRQLAYGNGIRLERMVGHVMLVGLEVFAIHLFNSISIHFQIEMEEYNKCLLFRKF